MTEKQQSVEGLIETILDAEMETGVENPLHSQFLGAVEELEGRQKALQTIADSWGMVKRFTKMTQDHPMFALDRHMWDHLEDLARASDAQILQVEAAPVARPRAAPRVDPIGGNQGMFAAVPAGVRGRLAPHVLGDDLAPMAALAQVEVDRDQQVVNARAVERARMQEMIRQHNLEMERDAEVNDRGNVEFIRG